MIRVRLHDKMVSSCFNVSGKAVKKFTLLVLLLVIIFKPGPAVPTGGRALLIGIRDYSLSGLPSLRGPRNDILLTKEILCRKLLFKEHHIKVLTGKSATHLGLEQAFYQLAKEVEQGDIVYIHYSGHGSRVPDRDGDEHPQIFDQTLVPYGSRSPGMKGKNRFDIVDDELHLWLIPIYQKAGQLIFVSDACYSASVTRSAQLTPRAAPPDIRPYDYLPTGPMSPGDYPSPGELSDLKRLVFIGSVRDDGVAYESTINGTCHGLFSRHWANALQNALPGETWSDLFKRTQAKVADSCSLQEPQFHGNTELPVCLITDSPYSRQLRQSKKSPRPERTKHSTLQKIPASSFSHTTSKRPPRIAIGRVWNNGKIVRLEAGTLSGVSKGDRFRLYQPGPMTCRHIRKTSKGVPFIKIRRVTSFYSEGTAFGNLKVGDLVIRENSPAHPSIYNQWCRLLSGITPAMEYMKENLCRLSRFNRLKTLPPGRRIAVDLSVSLWLPLTDESSSVFATENRREIITLKDIPGGFIKSRDLGTAEEMVLPQGGFLDFKIKNSGKTDYYVYLLIAMDNGIVKLFFPKPGHRAQTALLPAGKEIEPHDVLMSATPGREMVTLLVGETPIDISNWRQDAFNRNGANPNQAPGRLHVSTKRRQTTDKKSLLDGPHHSARLTAGRGSKLIKNQWATKRIFFRVSDDK
ncbi:MAG: caspase family protein [bacterium]|nr:caspase family protein [bacterium]